MPLIEVLKGSSYLFESHIMTVVEIGNGNKIHFELLVNFLGGEVKSTNHLDALWDGKFSKCIS